MQSQVKIDHGLFHQALTVLEWRTLASKWIVTTQYFLFYKKSTKTRKLIVHAMLSCFRLFSLNKMWLMTVGEETALKAKETNCLATTTSSYVTPLEHIRGFCRCSNFFASAAFLVIQHFHNEVDVSSGKNGTEIPWKLSKSSFAGDGKGVRMTWLRWRN